MGMKSDIKLIDAKGKRLDGRRADEMRPLKIEVGVVEQANGSAYLEWGGNKVIAAVYGPRECLPRHKASPYGTTIMYRYNMAPFSVDDRKRPGRDRRSTEISKISEEALSRVVLGDRFPNTMINVNVEILQADAGTRCAGLSAASVALADAGIPMKDMVSACAAGKVGNHVVLDLGKKEDNFGKADVPIAIMPHTGDVVLLQMDGDLSPAEFKKALKLAKEGCMMVYEEQKRALKAKYDGGEKK
jgi:exosome complex component RRP41